MVLNKKQHFFEDTKTYNSFVKIRKEHLNRVQAKQIIELDFYEFLEYKKRLEANKQKDSDDKTDIIDTKETLFSMDKSIKKNESDSDVQSYLKSKLATYLRKW